MSVRPEARSITPVRRVAGLLSSLLLGAVLVFSAGTKILAPSAFLSSVSDYGILGSRWVLPAGAGITALEVALGAMLILGLGRRWAARAALPLILLFVAMIVYAIRAGLSDCGCFGAVIKMPPAMELGVDMVLLLLVGLVLAWGEDLVPVGHRLTAFAGWGAFLLGGVLFLSGNPVTASGERLEIEPAQLQLLSQAQPPLDVSEGDHFIFLFSADCDHCWAFAGGVELMHQRLEGVSVEAVTFSDPASLAEFRRAFAPSYPIHVLDSERFDELTKMYPAAIWIQGGQVTDSWSGFVPSHRELAESGGYAYRQSAATLGDTTPEEDGSPFGGAIRAGRQ